MLFLILLALIVIAVIWRLKGERALSRNERLYLKRRGYEPPSEAEAAARPVSKDTRLFSLIESLSDISPFARQRAAEELSRTCLDGNRDSRMLSALVTALEDFDASVRGAAATALGNLGDTHATEALNGRLEMEESVPVRVAVEKALLKLRDNHSSNGPERQ